MEWYLDAHTCTLYHHVEGLWTHQDATDIGRIRFQVEAHSWGASNQYSHVVEVCGHVRYMEIVGNHKMSETQIPTPEHLI
jgi:hypothetical protein